MEDEKRLQTIVDWPSRRGTFAFTDIKRTEIKSKTNGTGWLTDCLTFVRLTFRHCHKSQQIVAFPSNDVRIFLYFLLSTSFPCCFTFRSFCYLFFATPQKLCRSKKCPILPTPPLLPPLLPS